MVNKLDSNDPIKLLKESVEFYKKNRDIIKADSTVQVHGLDLDLNYSRTLFELGFLYGSTTKIKEALSLNPLLAPKSLATVYVFYLNFKKGNFTLTEMQLSKPTVILEWGKWRLEGIIRKEFSAARFPTVNSQFIEDLTEKGARILSNLPRDSSAELNLSYKGGNFKRTTRTTSHYELARASQYRFSDEVLFDTPISPYEICKLTGSYTSPRLSGTRA